MSLLQQFSGSSAPIDFHRQRRLLDWHKRSVDPHAIVLIAQVPQVVEKAVPGGAAFRKLFTDYQVKTHQRLYNRINDGKIWGNVVPVRETSQQFRRSFYGLNQEQSLSASQLEGRHPVCFLQDYIAAMCASSYLYPDIVRTYENVALRNGEGLIVENFWSAVRDDLSDFRRLFPDAPKPPSDDDDPRPRTPLKLSLPPLPMFGLGSRAKTA